MIGSRHLQMRLAFSRRLKPSFRRLHSVPNSGSTWKHPGTPVVLLGSGLGMFITGYTYHRHYLLNDVHSVNSTIHELAPKAGEETFEMGLFKSSQAEERREYDLYRQERLSKGNWVTRVAYRIWFAIEDWVLDPVITFGRFLELLGIFVPVLLSSPMCWFGSKKTLAGHEGTVRLGALAWFKLVRIAAELAGATFIKLGQWAASRTDIFPRGLCDELSKLHSNAKVHLLEKTKKIVSSSFGLPFDEIFDQFSEKPLGVGAIAQVYVGKLSEKVIQQTRERELEESKKVKHEDQQWWKNLVITEHKLSSNTLVAIKVLHPNVEVKINRDLKLMMFFAKIVNAIPTMEWLSLPDEVEQFSLLMRLQLDLRIEGLNLARFRRNFQDKLEIYFPKPYLNYTTRDILVEEFMEAIPMSTMLKLKTEEPKGSVSPPLFKEISDKGLDAFLKMLILDNFTHADLHPGNMMVRFYKNELYKHEKEYKIVKSSNSEEETNRITENLKQLLTNEEWYAKMNELYEEGYHAEICFLDVGLVTELNHEDRVNFIDLFRALSEFDGYRAGELMVERSRTPQTVIDKELFALKVEKLVDRIKQRTFTLGSVSIGDLLDQVLSMVRRHHVRMEGDFVTIVVAILLLEGIGRQLDPQLDLFASSLPVLRKLSVLKEGIELLRNEDSLNMVKVWLALEVRQFIHASIQDINFLVKSDMLSPNV